MSVDATLKAGDVPWQDFGMATTDPRIDAYIAKAQPFARPILTELRKRVHRTLPTIEETMKWSMPFFVVGGKIVATMAAFKQHARYGIWTAGTPRFARVDHLRDLPPARSFAKALRESAERPAKGSGMRVAPAKKATARVTVPPALAAALRRNAKARAAFDAMPPGHRREYARWIAEAKRPETTARRVAQAMRQLARGRERNWRYRS